MKMNKLGLSLLIVGFIILIFSFGKVAHLFAFAEMPGYSFGQLKSSTGGGLLTVNRNGGDFSSVEVYGHKYYLTFSSWDFGTGAIGKLSRDGVVNTISLNIVPVGDSRMQQDFPVYDLTNGAKYSGLCTYNKLDGGNIVKCWVGVYEPMYPITTPLPPVEAPNIKVYAPTNAVAGEIVTFTAKYLYQDSFISGAKCHIDFNIGGDWIGAEWMSESTNAYTYQKQLSAGTVKWDIRCSKTGYDTATTTGTLTVQAQSKPPLDNGLPPPDPVLDKCSSTSDCEEKEICVGGICVVDSTTPLVDGCTLDTDCEEGEYCIKSTGQCDELKDGRTCKKIDENTAEIDGQNVSMTVENKDVISRFDLNTCLYRNEEKNVLDKWTCFDEGCISNVFIISIISSIAMIGVGGFLLLRK